jgi:diguanylate cyclase (GGDEF)-like protein/PAS domain S-box-containing protein
LASEQPVRLLVVDKSSHVADLIVSQLRSAGVHARSEFAQDLANARSDLKNHQLDLVICATDMGTPTLAEVSEAIKQSGQHLSLLAMVPDQIVTEQVVEAMNLGARDMICKEELDHLVHVVRREYQALLNAREYGRVEKALQESEQRSEGILSTSKDAVAYVAEGMHVYANEAYLELFGYEDFEELEGMPLMDMVGAGDQAAVKELLRTLAKNPSERAEKDLKLRHSDGTEFEAHLEFGSGSYEGEPCAQILIRDSGGGDTGELEKRIEEMKILDVVTGLYNRQYLMDQLRSAVESATSGSAQSTLLNIELDGFDDIKAKRGIAASDILIADVAKLLKTNLGDKHIAARLDNNVFTALVYDGDRKRMVALTDKIRKAIEGNITESERGSITTTCSIGICYLDESSPPDPYEMLSRAERASTQASTGGGNRVQLYQPAAGEMTQQEEDKEWIDAIKKALKDNRLQLLYQPIVSLQGDPGERYEVVVRLLDKDNETVPPEKFMPAAERSGLAKGIDRWVIGNALKKLAAERKAGKKDLVLFLELSAGSIADKGLLKWLAEQMKSAMVPGANLVFALNESNAINHLSEVKDFATGLSALKCEFCLDDFGTGVNPFQLLKHIKATYLKVDGAFMENLAGNNENQESLRNIASTANESGMVTIAQQVEDAGTLSVIFGMGINYIQGSFLQEPVETMEYDFSSMGM